MDRGNFGPLLRGMGYCSAARSGSVREPVEASGTSGSCPEAGGRQWKLVEDKEGVGRGLGGSGEVWEVRRRSGKPWESAEEAGKAREVMVRYITGRTRISPELCATPISNWSDSDPYVTFRLGSRCILLPDLF